LTTRPTTEPVPRDPLQPVIFPPQPQTTRQACPPPPPPYWPITKISGPCLRQTRTLAAKSLKRERLITSALRLVFETHWPAPNWRQSSIYRRSRAAGKPAKAWIFVGNLPTRPQTKDRFCDPRLAYCVSPLV